MVSGQLKKLALANSLQVAHGVAYGFLRGYCTTLSDGGGMKYMTVSTRFADDAGRYAFTQHIQNMRLDKEYKLNALEVQEKIIRIEFTDSIGVMKRMENFIEVFFPLLDQYGASRSNVCPECGMMLSGGRWKLINGIAVYVHESCAEKLRATIDDDKSARLGTGSYASGALGALVGALGGSVAWAILYMLGYIASIIGFLIGFLAEKCYNWFGGKKGWGKLAILIVAVIAGVIIGNFFGFSLQVTKETGIALGDSISMVAEYISDGGIGNFLSECVMGLLFAGLGVFTIMKATKDEVTGPGFIDLD